MSADMQFKQCNRCLAKLPVSDFAMSKYSKDTYGPCCKACHSQRFRLTRRVKYNAKSIIDDSTIRYVAEHNESIVDIVLSLPTLTLECRAFDVSSKADYKVFFGKSDRLGMNAVTIFNMDGSLFYEYAYSGLRDPKPTILNWVKGFNLRLELSDVDALNSKQTIYYI